MAEPARSLVVVRSLKNTPVPEAVRDCLEHCNWEDRVPRDARVIIKPNLCTAVQDRVEAANTSEPVARAVCEVLLSRTSRITIGESGHLRQNPWQAYEASGYRRLARELGIELVNFSELPTVTVRCGAAAELRMPRCLLEADVFINVPKLKTHALTYFTGALKNHWGCVPDCRDRLHWHRHLDEMLCGLQGLLKPGLVLMDGIVGMDQRGPVAGRPRALNVLLASTDAVALDATAMRLVGLDPARARHVALAASMGLGKFSLTGIDVDVRGEWDRFAQGFVPPPYDFANSMMFYVTQYRWFVEHILANDLIYYPIRDLVQLMRRVRRTMLGLRISGDEIADAGTAGQRN